MNIKITKITFEDIPARQRDASKLRGFFADTFKDRLLFHNHDGAGFVYGYPMIQYKIIRGAPTLLGINEGADEILRAVPQIRFIRLGEKDVRVGRVSFETSACGFGVTGRSRCYRFLTPWLALNQPNFGVYKHMDAAGRREKLSAILTGNLLSMAKSLGYEVTREITADLAVSEKRVQYKNCGMMCFAGTFCVNFQIPELLGLGRSVSRGFGAVGAISAGAAENSDCRFSKNPV